MRRALALAMLGALASPTAAAAAPTLREFLAATAQGDLDVREQGATADEKAAAARVDDAALWPRLSLTADYLHNQHAVIVDIPTGSGAGVAATITPSDQVDATLQLDVPLVDLGARRRATASARDRDAAQASREVTLLEARRGVVRAYYQWVGGTALLRSTRAARQTAADDVAVLESRFAAGLAAELDVARARAQVARADQTLAEAALAIANAQRTLRTLTGLEAAGDAPPLPEAVGAEAPLTAWLAKLDGAPEVVSARASATAAAARESAARLTYAPTIGLLARERLTNAAGFGQAANWTVGVTASWSLDRATPARVDQSAATAATAGLRVAHASQTVRDRVVDAWNQIDALRARAAAAAAAADADHLAARIAVGKLAAGQATQLDVLLAERDALDADVVLVQARADLAAARALLRLAAGAADAEGGPEGAP